jgi:glutamine phosphoribosylpyrophosphate amidotransferase
VGALRTTALLVHLRRPSKLSTLQLPDTQPFDDPAGRFSFSHNGDLRDYQPLRARYRGEGRIHGRADTEVGARWLEDAWRDDTPPALTLAALHDRFGGQANLAILAADGTPHHYAGNSDNPVFTFRLGQIGVASTGIYSLDRSLFRYVAHGATDRRLVRERVTVSLARNGNPRLTS